jgi:transcription factor MYB, plant
MFNAFLGYSAVRSCRSDLKENIGPNMRLFGQEKSTQDARQPLAIISSSNKDDVKIMETQNISSKTPAKQLIGRQKNC